MKRYKIINIIGGWLVFLIAAVVYTLTVEPTTSFWDCGEFITTAYKLEVGHPPGAPFFMVLGRVFSLFAMGDTSQVAFMINMISVLASALTIMFLFWTISHIAKKTILAYGEDWQKNPQLVRGTPNTSQTIAIMGSALVGALAYTFSDTFWFSAVEGEVYATSSLFTAVVFWAILKWESNFDEKYNLRWIIFIAFLMGLSIGVHLLNLLAIPAIVFVYYFKKYTPTKKGVFLASAISVMLLVVIMYGIVPGIVKVASQFELLFVNSLGAAFNTGIIVYAIALIAAIIGGLYFSRKSEVNPILVTATASLAIVLLGIPFLTGSVLLGIILVAATVLGVYYIVKKNPAILNTILTALTVIVIGYSTFAIIIIRSHADPPMDQNDPETLFALKSYLNREQYGDRPLFYGQYFNSEVIDYDEGAPTYVKKDGRYEIIDRKVIRKYASSDQSLFPRMYSEQRSPDHVGGYIKWTEVDPSKGRPSFAENLEFFFQYQVNFMYIRYFMWNFVGRQNDIQGHGGIQNGNWLSGVNFIDELRLGPQDKIPETQKNNPGRNKYYFLPLILGILGMVYLAYASYRDFWVVLLLFIFTGIAIVVYLNQPPYQPRERDYAYAGSFYAFAIYLGLGVLAIYRFIKEHITPVGGAVAATIVSLLAAPVLMGFQNWDDHDRSGRYTAREFARNYLNSCGKNGILFTNGDNDTFPLWYAQEVEGIRTDVRVINLSYFNTDWYINQMRKQVYDSPPVKFTLTPEQIIPGKRDIVYILEDPKVKGHIELREIIDFVASSSPKTKRVSRSGDTISYIPTVKIKMNIDSAEMIKKGVVDEQDADDIVDIRWTLEMGRQPKHIRKNELMVLDLLASNNWDRPIYYAVTVGHDNYLNLSDYFQLDGLAYRIVPLYSGDGKRGQTGRVNTEIMYKKLMEEFDWGGLSDPNVYLDENNRRMTMNVKSNYARLAEQLIFEGKKDSARKVLDYCQELLPPERVEYNYYDLLIGENYYQLGDFEKGNQTMRDLADVMKDNLDYYMSLPEKYAVALEEDTRRDAMIFQEIIRYAKVYNQTELQEELQADFEQMFRQYE